MNNIQKTIMTLSLVCAVLVSVPYADATYNDAREQYQKEKEFYKESRKQFLQEKERFKNAKDKSQYEEVAKSHLIKVIDVLIAKLERIETWVSNRVALSESEKNTIIAEINEDKQWLTTEQGKVEDASGEEIREHAKDVKEYWFDNRIDIKKIIGQVLAGRTEYAIEKMETVSEKLESAIQKAESDGEDVDNAKKLLGELNTKVDRAKLDVQSAKKLFDDISSWQDGDDFFQQVKDYLNKAHNYLKDSHKIAKDIINELRS